MNTQTVCRMCNAEGVKLYCINNTYKQEIYENETGTSYLIEDCKPSLACMTCCDRLEQKETVLKMMVSNNENLIMNMAAIPPEEHGNNTCVVQRDGHQCISMKPEQMSEVDVKEENTLTGVADNACQQMEGKDKANTENALLSGEVTLSVTSPDNSAFSVCMYEENTNEEMGPNEVTTSIQTQSCDGDEDEDDFTLRWSESEEDESHTIQAPSHDFTLNQTSDDLIGILTESCDGDEDEDDFTLRWSDSEEDESHTIQAPSHDLPLNQTSDDLIGAEPVNKKQTMKTLTIVLERCDYMINKKHAPRRVTRSNKYEDTTCKKKNKLINAVNSSQNQTKRYECDICYKHFTSKRGLIPHIRSHTSDKPHKCNTCNKSFCHKGYLIRHKLIHTGDIHKCNSCNKIFSTKRNLNMRNRLHTGYCNIAYTQKKNLVRHLRSKCNHSR